ncbi:DUF2341 domain-containing protein, partial [Fibrobacterota bacterium]
MILFSQKPGRMIKGGVFLRPFFLRRKNITLRPVIFLWLVLTLVSSGLPQDYSAWTYSATVTVNTSGLGITGTVTNYPLLVRLNSVNFDFSQAQSDGRDIRFSTSGGSPLAYEIERWNASVPAAEIWVKLDNIDLNNSSQFFRMYWGNLSAASESNPENVFETANGFDAVWHLGEDGNSNVGGYQDATANAYHGTGVDMDAGSDVSSVIGIGQQFDGTVDYIEIAGSAGSQLNYAETGTYTISAWAYATAVSTINQPIVSKGDHQHSLQLIRDTGEWEFVTFTAGWEVNQNAAQLGRWVHVTGVRNGTGQVLYVDGVSVVSAPTIIASTDEFRDETHNVWLGANAEQSDYFFDGSLDEVRISGVAHSANWIRLNYETQRANQSIISIQPDEDLSNWGQQVPIFLNTTGTGADVTGTVSNFPLLIRLTSGNFDFSQAQANGEDIRFTTSGGNILSHEIERWDQSGQVAEVWVRMNQITGNNDAQSIIMYYDNPSANSASNSAAVFSGGNGFAGVWHMDATLADATSNGRNGTNSGSTNITGQVADGRDFTSGTSISVSGLMGAPSDITLSGWGRLDAVDVSGAELISVGDYAAIRLDYLTGSMGHYYDGSTWLLVNSSQYHAGTGWHHFAYAIDDQANSQILYIDGVQAGTGSNTTSISYSGLGSNTIIGNHGNGGINSNFDGTIDEVRVSNTARSASWIKLCYENQRSNQTLYTISS